MRHGSLFSGIGGFDLASEWVGWDNVFSCEINPFGRKVLEYYWPDTKHYEDITKTDFAKYKGTIDILSGGFPCQPFSLAGKRKGTKDDRNLWPEMLRVIRESSPTWILGENVYGLINWNRGLVFDQVQADLEAEGYEVVPVLLPAVSIDAPHRRDRIWFIAHSMRNGFNGCNGKNEIHPGEAGINAFNDSSEDATRGTITNTSSKRLPPERANGKPGRNVRFSKRNAHKTKSAWEVFPTQHPICSGDDEFSGRLDSITFPKWRKESIKAYGNAVVPELVYEIFKVIQEYEILH